jgi:hypothetical protein
VAALPKYSRRAAPPKLVALSNALLAVADPQGPPEPSRDPARFGAWVENACLASAWNAGQQVAYWREEPFEVDAVIEGDWGRWAVEIKTGPVTPAELRGLLEFTRRTPAYRPLLVGEGTALAVGERLGIQTTDWRDFLVSGPPDAGVAR